MANIIMRMMKRKIPYYDLSKHVFSGDEETAEHIIETLKSEQLYAPTHLYRAISATRNTLQKILQFGTDRHTSPKKMQQHLQNVTQSLREKANDYDIPCGESDFMIAADPMLIWCGEEPKLVELINGYAMKSKASVIPMVTVYDQAGLTNDESSDAYRLPDLYRFKRNPLEVIVAAFRL